LFIDVPEQKVCPFLTCKLAHDPRAVFDKIGQPVFLVDWIGTWPKQVNFHHVAHFDHAPASVAHITQEQAAKLLDWAHPCYVTVCLRLVDKTRCADAAAHTGHGHD
jgi:hypothetical protein